MLAGRVTACVGAGIHRPRPLRYIAHHVLPQACGGKTEPGNLVGLCDNCHMAVHALLWQLKQSTPPIMLTAGTRQQRALALRGYQAAVAAGTVAQIPDEGL